MHHITKINKKNNSQKKRSRQIEVTKRQKILKTSLSSSFGRDGFESILRQSLLFFKAVSYCLWHFTAATTESTTSGEVFTTKTCN